MRARFSRPWAALPLRARRERALAQATAKARDVSLWGKAIGAAGAAVFAYCALGHVRPR